ncbi:MAG TPA: 6-carboxytetrahydropterin synthase [Gemmatimonadales bacterium]|nr:6-carboxytetrahydropterin synthase [Gemmatimonadales bacterium]
MPTSYLTRIVEFTAGHRIRRADWSPEQNARAFGKAAHEHSHHYQCRVTVKGPLHAASGGVVNLQALDHLLSEVIVKRLDGKPIHEALPEFADGKHLATGEALAVYVWDQLVGRLPSGVALHAVRVQEGPNIYSEYFGEP